MASTPISIRRLCFGMVADMDIRNYGSRCSPLLLGRYRKFFQENKNQTSKRIIKMNSTEIMELLTNIRDNIKKAKDNADAMQKKLIAQEAEIKRLHEECSEANGRALTLSLKIIALKDRIKSVEDVYKDHNGFKDYNNIAFCYDMKCREFIPELISAITQTVESKDED